MKGNETTLMLLQARKQRFISAKESVNYWLNVKTFNKKGM